MFSIIIPVYRNEKSIPSLVAALEWLAEQVENRYRMDLEAVFVVDASPDSSFVELERHLPNAGFASRLLLHSRNFGSFAAIRTGLCAATGQYFGIMAADLQEPPELMIKFLDGLASDEHDVMVGCRESRADPLAARLASQVFWKLFRTLVISEMPLKGVDVFGCNRHFRDQLVRLEEAHSSLVGLIFWLGFRRGEVHYARRERQFGVSAWSFWKKADYLLDSVFSFTDLPVRLLAVFGAFGVAVSLLLGAVILILKMTGHLDVPGYAATMVTVMFFGGINALGLGIVGSYAWRTYENTKRRPLALTIMERTYASSKPVARHRTVGNRDD